MQAVTPEKNQPANDCILQSDTGRMPKQTKPSPEPDADPLWQKTPYANLVSYVPGGAYFARVRVAGKLIRRVPMIPDLVNLLKTSPSRAGGIRNLALPRFGGQALGDCVS